MLATRPLLLRRLPARPWAQALVSAGALAGTTSVLLVFQLGQPRIFMAMARDGLLPQYFARIHPRFRTPHVTTIWTGVVVGVVAMVTNIGELADLTNIGTLFAFILVCIGVNVLRRVNPERPRPFRVPFVPIFPLLGVFMCLALMLSLPVMTWIRFVVWLGNWAGDLFPLQRAPQQTPAWHRRRADRGHSSAVYQDVGFELCSMAQPKDPPAKTCGSVGRKSDSI